MYPATTLRRKPPPWLVTRRIKDIHRAYKVQGPELVCDDLVGVVASRMGSAEV